jgi:hypothetical protein
MARHVSVGVEEDIDVLGRARGRNVNQPKADAVSFQVDGDRPLKIGIAIPAHDCDRRSDAFQPNEQAGRAEVAEMPDFIDVVCQCFEVFREVIMRIGENKDPQRFAIH